MIRCADHDKTERPFVAVGNQTSGGERAIMCHLFHVFKLGHVVQSVNRCFTGYVSYVGEVLKIIEILNYYYYYYLCYYYYYYYYYYYLCCECCGTTSATYIATENC